MHRLGVVVMFACSAPRAPAVVVQPTAPAPVALDALLPGAPERLPNGVAVYRESRAHIQLVVRAGSLAEGDDQRGVARWVAELAAGAAGIPATVTVGYERTTIELATDDVARTLALITAPIDDAAIDADRARVVRRAGQGEPAAIAIASTVLAAHPPDGDPAALGAVTADRVRAFRTAWWTPSRLAVVVTTDASIDPLGALPSHAEAPEPMVPAAGGARGPDIVAAAEGHSAIDLSYLVPRRPLVHASDLRERVRRDVFVDALRARLARELGGWRPILATSIDANALSPRLSILSIHVESPASLGWLRDAVLPVIADVARRGLSRDELVAAIAERRRALAEALVPRRPEYGSIGGYRLSDREPARALAELGDHDLRRDDLVRRSLEVLPTPDDPTFAQLAAELALPRAAVRAEQVRGDASELTREMVDATPPRAGGAAAPPTPAPGRIVAEHGDTWELSNGAIVRFAPGPIEVTATTPGGALEEAGDRMFAALAVPDVAAVLAVGAFDAPARERWAAGRFELALDVEPHRHGLHARLRDAGALPDLLALIHATFAAPVRDDALIAGVLANRMLERAKQGDAPPVPARLALELGMDLPARTLHPDDVWTSLRARFGHAAGFTFTLQGIDPAEARAAVERYLASIPAGTPDRAGPAVQPSGHLVVPRDQGCGIELHWTGIGTGLLDDTDIVAAAIDAAPELNADAGWLGSSPEAFHVRVETSWRCREHGTSEAAIRQLVARYAHGTVDDETLADIRSALAKRLDVPETDPRVVALDRARLAAAMKRLAPGARMVVVR